MSKADQNTNATANVQEVPAPRDPLEAKITPGNDQLRLNDWTPPQNGIIPLIRFKKNWYSILWALPIIFVLLVAAVAIAQGLREVPSIQMFIQNYPGAPVSAAVVETGFPLWLRVSHFLNLLFMVFIMRSGVQILADHPRLYWHRMVPLSEAGAEGAGLDLQGRFSDHPGLVRHPWCSPFYWAGSLVALFGQFALAAQRHRHLYSAVLHGSVAADRPDDVGSLSERRIGRVAVSVTQLPAGRELDQV